MSAVSIARIQEVVAQDFGVSLRELVGGRRQKDVVLPRQVAIALAFKLTEHSSTVIGRHFGGRDHSTALSAHRRVAQLRHYDEGLRRRLQRIEERLVPLVDKPGEVQLAFFIGPLFDAVGIVA